MLIATYVLNGKSHPVAIGKNLRSLAGVFFFFFLVADLEGILVRFLSTETEIFSKNWVISTVSAKLHQESFV